MGSRERSNGRDHYDKRNERDYRGFKGNSEMSFETNLKRTNSRKNDFGPSTSKRVRGNDNEEERERQSENNACDSRPPPLSFTETKSILIKMLDDTYSENISLKLLDPGVRLLNFLNSPKNESIEVVKIILKIIIKESSNKMMEKNFRELLTMILQTKFAKEWLDKMINSHLLPSSDFDMLHLIIIFFQLNFELIPGIAYDVFNNRICNLGHIIDVFQLRNSNISQEIINKFEELKVLAEASSVPISKKNKAKRSSYFNDMEPPDNYRSIGIFPNLHELTDVQTKDVFLRENKSQGAYKSVHHYLDVHFRLMREDFIQPLREGLCAYKNKNHEKRCEIHVYKNVKLVFTFPAKKQGLLHVIIFDKSFYKKENWAKSKRFLYGSLVCLSNDDFKTMFFGTIAIREISDLKKGLLAVKFYESLPSRNEEYTLIETTNMFETYKHVLLKLQDTNSDNLPLQDYLVYMKVDIKSPKYTEDNNNLKNELKWAREIKLNMDESQFQAFEGALTKEIAIIQGPPGTGKTYMGLHICKCFINILQEDNPDFGPILVVCYTNHALDQFLEGIANYTKKIVRIGGRCQSEKIQQFSIVKYKKANPSNIYGPRKGYIYKDMKKLEKEIIYCLDILIKYEKELLSLDIIEEFLTKNQVKYLRNIGLTEWLYGKSFKMKDSLIEEIINALIDVEIKLNVKPVIEDTIKEISKNIDDLYDSDMDNEVNYINNQRKLEIDEDDFTSINDEFREIFNASNEEDEDNGEVEMMIRNTTARLIAFQLGNKKEVLKEDAIKFISLDETKFDERWGLYRYWKSKYIHSVDENLETLEKQYENLSDQLNEIVFEEDKDIMKAQNIIGMTTTGAARYNKVLSHLCCKIIIVEEAAQVLESHIIGSLNKGCEHLILIGDHKQLKPNPAVYELAKGYGLDISLFERLVNNDLQYYTLTMQHRMRPEIAEIMRFIYKDLKNHESVMNYPNVAGVCKNIYFINHYDPEQCNKDTMSYSNPFEAEFIIKFCRYLMKNGVERKQITILTLYSGQMTLFRQQMDKKIYEGVRVSVVDNYQGEENDIILLSLVRSNEYDKIGFLNVENRICVSLSRAKQGLYVFGNFSVITHKSMKWKEICEFLKLKGMIGDSLEVFCQNHPKKILTISKPTDFDKYPEGGCDELCDKRLQCGHVCLKMCHFLDKNHEKNKCMSKCKKKCTNGHMCKLNCWQACTECGYEMEKIIPYCHHKQIMKCSKTPQMSDCLNKCERVLDCGHPCTKLCKDDCDKCLIKVKKPSPECGHYGEFQCFDKEIKCKKSCRSTLGCGHPCLGTCGICYNGRLHKKCENPCKAQLICGHVCKEKCSSFCPPCQNRCEERCFHNSCPNYCGDDCVLCYEECKWVCEHQRCNKKCFELCDRSPCNEICYKKMICNKCKILFMCHGICGEICMKQCLKCDTDIREVFFGTENNDNARFITLETCGHGFEVESMDKYMSSESENEEIVVKRCPKCKTIINKSSCFRYLNIVKRLSFNIKNIQKKISDSLETVEYSEYSRKREEYSGIVETIFMMNKMENYFDLSMPTNKYMILLFNTSLNLIYDLYKLCVSEGLGEDLQYTKECIRHLLIWLNPLKRRFNEFEIKQFNDEFDRIKMIIKMNEDIRNIDISSEAIDEFSEIKTMIFSGDSAKQFKLKWNEFRKRRLCLPNMGITEYQRKEIVKAIGLGKGRWFKCQRGHYYIIGECGGPNEISRCPECNSSIGGSSHRLLHGNQHAPEMDLSDEPSWPGLKNL